MTQSFGVKIYPGYRIAHPEERVYLAEWFGRKWIYIHKHAYIYTLFSLTHPEKGAWPGRIHLNRFQGHLVSVC